MTRENYELIKRHLREMMNEVLEPLLGETMTLRVAAQTADTLNEFILALREVASGLGIDGRPFIDDDFDAMDREIADLLSDPAFAAFDDRDADDNIVAIGDDKTEPVDRSEYEAFVAKRRAGG